jgi:hypothetical protein
MTFIFDQGLRPQAKTAILKRHRLNGIRQVAQNDTIFDGVFPLTIRQSAESAISDWQMSRVDGPPVDQHVTFSQVKIQFSDM